MTKVDCYDLYFLRYAKCTESKSEYIMLSAKTHGSLLMNSKERYEPGNKKINTMTCLYSKDSDQPAQPHMSF